MWICASAAIYDFSTTGDLDVKRVSCTFVTALSSSQD